MKDPLRYYHLEQYLFEDVNSRFHDAGWLNAFDFFSIVIWKANRAKSNVAKRLLRHDPESRIDLDAIVRHLTRRLYDAASARDRLEMLMIDWGLKLPMASAILTVLWPDEFTVYDVRACEQFGRFGNLTNLTRPEAVWDGYTSYRTAVIAAVPGETSLRDKDRILWGRSAAAQLERDIASRFTSSADRRGPGVDNT